MKKFLSFDDVLIMPRYTDVSFSEIDLSVELSKKLKLKIPIIASPMSTVCEIEMALTLAEMGGLGILHRNMTPDDQIRAIKLCKRNNFLVGAAIGSGDDLLERLSKIVETEVDLIAIENAIGYSKQVLDLIKLIRTKTNISLLSGNIASRGAIWSYRKFSPILIRLGSGAGATCKSRVVSGVGVPQLSAIKIASQFNLFSKNKLIADGGIRTSADIVKALGAGADAVMLGSALAGTKEAPGQILNVNGSAFKTHMGMGSHTAMFNGSADRYNQKSSSLAGSEGIEGLVPFKGSVREVIDELVYGIKMGCLRTGSKNLKELRENSTFIQISHAGILESKPNLDNITITKS